MGSTDVERHYVPDEKRCDFIHSKTFGHSPQIHQMKLTLLNNVSFPKIAVIQELQFMKKQMGIWIRGSKSGYIPMQSNIYFVQLV